MIRSHGIILVASMILFGFAGLGVASLSDKRYTARADVFVSAGAGQGSLSQGATYSQDQAQNFAAVASRAIVLQAVVDDLNLDVSAATLGGHVRAVVPLNTSIISISVTEGSAGEAADIANSVATNLASAVGQLIPGTNSSSPPVSLRVIQQASTPTHPSGPRPAVNVIIGVLLGLCIGVAIAAARDAQSGRRRLSGSGAAVDRQELPEQVS